MKCVTQIHVHHLKICAASYSMLFSLMGKAYFTPIQTILVLKLFQFFMKSRDRELVFKPSTLVALIMRKSSILLKRQFSTMLVS